MKALLNVRDSVVDRNHVKLMYEVKPVTRAHTSLDTTIYIFERKYTNAWQGLSNFKPHGTQQNSYLGENLQMY